MQETGKQRIRYIFKRVFTVDPRVQKNIGNDLFPLFDVLIVMNFSGVAVYEDFISESFIPIDVLVVLSVE